MKLNKSNNTRGLFITGTDTGVGKTYVTEKILQQLSTQSISCVAMKPVASGAKQTSDGLRNDDALKLQLASSVDAPYELINPYCFEPAIAPHLAAQQTGVAILASVIVDAFQALSSLAEVVIVEGVGGWQVPLNSQANNVLSVYSLAEQLQLPVVLVVGMRVGCLNHALLSSHSIYSGRCPMAGWIANSIDKDLLHSQDQIHFLQQHITSPLLGNLPWCDLDADAENYFNNDVVIDLDHLLINS